MYCIHCGEKIGETAKFCPSCGKQQDFDTEASIDLEAPSRSTDNPTDHVDNSGTLSDKESSLEDGQLASQIDVNLKGKSINRRKWYMVGGIASGIVIVLGGGFLTTHFLGQSDMKKAQAAAGAGHYALALSEAQTAGRLELFSSEPADRARIYALANEVSNQDEQAQKSLKAGDFQGAISKFTSAQNLMEKQSDSVFKALQTQVKIGISEGKVGLLEQQALKSSDVSNVAGILSQIETFGSVSKQAQSAVQSRLESVSSQQVAADIADDNFDAATQLVQEALKPNASDAKISNLNQTIQSAKTAYEQKQQQIEEQALAQAAQNANLNEHPIVLNNISVTLDQYGNTDAAGTVANQATHAVGNVELTIAFYDNNSNLVDTEYTYVSPSVLNSGDVGSFDVSIPYYYGAVSAVVTYYTWLNE